MYYCFGCGVTGDAVDLTAQLLGLSPKDAALRLAADFGIEVDEKAKPNAFHPYRPRADPQKELQKWFDHAWNVLLEYRSLLRDWEKRYAPQSMDEEWHPLFCEALDKKDYIDYLLDELMLCSKDQFEEMRNNCGKEVEKIGKRNKKKDDLHLNKHAMHLIRLFMMGIDILEKEGGKRGYVLEVGLAELIYPFIQSVY